MKLARTTTGKAKILTERQIKNALSICSTTRERCMFLLSVRGALRSVEIAGIRWRHIRPPMLELTPDICKYDKPREVPMNDDLAAALEEYRAELDPSDDDLLFPDRKSKVRRRVSANAVTQWFKYFYKHRMQLDGQYSSHSGRRTAITNMARNIALAGGSMKDVMRIAGHGSMKVTEGYIETSSDAAMKVVNMKGS